MTGQASATILRSASAEPPIPLLMELLACFGDQDIRYCYWRSGRRVQEALSGRCDLDLLIAHKDQHRARLTLLACGFKRFPAIAARDHSAICSFLGHDPASGAIVHVHAHFRLVVGGKLLHDYRLPWEEILLTRAVSDSGLPIRVLDPAGEALLLIVRACLELKRTDPVVLRRWTAAAERFERDRQDLAGRVDPAALRELAAGTLGGELAEEIMAALFAPEPLQRQRSLRRRVRRVLAERRAYTAPEALLRTLARGAAWMAGGVNRQVLHLPRPWSRRAAGGGCIVAVLGVDGSGKSTVVRSLRSWLGAELDVMPVYFGTGDGRPSLLLLPFKLLVPLVRRLFPSKPQGASHGRISERPPGFLYSVLLSAWAALAAAEKRTKLRRAHRAAARGMIVITDRYPQDQDRTYNDGPLLHRMRWSPGWLRRYEDRAYTMAGRMPPDLVLKLDVTPETAAARETDMDRAVIAQRVASVRQLSFPGARVVTLDAEQPLAAVLRASRHEVWQTL